MEIPTTVCWERDLWFIFLLHGEGGCGHIDLMLDARPRISMLFKSMLQKVVTSSVKVVSHKPPEETSSVSGCLHANVIFGTYRWIP